VKQRVTRLGNGAGGGGVDGVKNRSGQWEGLGGGELNGCIMHRVHTSLYYNTNLCAQKYINTIYPKVDGLIGNVVS
jgi:hypothetical protein